MSSTKEKAIELLYKFMPIVECGDNRYSDKIQKQNAKQCALIAIDEIIKAIDFDWMEIQNLENQHRFWNQVKIEIENL